MPMGRRERDAPPHRLGTLQSDERRRGLRELRPPAGGGAGHGAAPGGAQRAAVRRVEPRVRHLRADSELCHHAARSGPLVGGTWINVSAAAPSRDDSCEFYANDGICDEPWVCAAGTDCPDCAAHNGTLCGLRPGTDRRCRFATTNSTADGSSSLVSSSVAASVHGSQLLCQSPRRSWSPHSSSSSSSGGGGAAVLHSVSLSLNGQQYTAATAAYAFYAAPTVSSAVPSNGPAAGGTVIVVSGSNLAGGDDYRCDIGGNELIPARYDPSNGTVVCSPTPATLSLSASAPFTIRLNAQERVSSSSTFRIFAPPQIDSITPSSGTFLGNTTVTFRGTNFVDSAAAGELRFRFGTQEVPGTFESPSSAVCVSPPADYAGAMASYDWMAAGDEVVGTEGYIPDPPETRVTAYGLTLLGAAVLKPVAYGEDYGYVRLVQSAYSGPGAIILPPIPQPYAGASPYFDASFDIRLWGSASHHGLSFCYGDLPAQAWGEVGASLGLCIQFSTPTLASSCIIAAVSAPTRACPRAPSCATGSGAWLASRTQRTAKASSSR